MNASALTEAELLEELPVGVAFIERRSIVQCNRLLEQMLHYEPGELAGKPLGALFRTEPSWPLADQDAELLRKDGAGLACRLLARLLGAQRAALVVIRREALTYYDALTGLPNRRLFDDRLQQALASARRHERSLAAMLLDLDALRQVNATLGRSGGDALLREVAERLAACLRKGDTLARHAGDEFAILIAELQSETHCSAIAERILRALAPEFRFEGRAFPLAASLGISIFPRDAPQAEALLRNADAAMHGAKRQGKNRYAFYGK